MAELIQDFLEFYRLDYSLAIFKPETNLTGKVDKSDLARKAGLSDSHDPSQPLLLQLLGAFNSGAVGSAVDIGSAAKQSSFNNKEEMKHVEPLSFKGVPENSMANVKGGRPADSTDKHLAKANNLLAELDREEKSGFNLRESHDDDDFDMGMSGKQDSSMKKDGGRLGGLTNLNGGISKESDNMGDNYDDDFDDDIEEDLPADQNDPLMDDADLNARSANVAGSGQGITVSQSLGVDPSVDSLALEDYDHVEPVERIA